MRGGADIAYACLFMLVLATIPLTPLIQVLVNERNGKVTSTAMLGKKWRDTRRKQADDTL